MISSGADSARGCYVHIVPPGETDFVTAGRLAIETGSGGAPVGRFVYGRSYLARENAVPIDPVELKLEPGTRDTAAFGGVFGALRDAAPDYWGRRVIEKHAGRAVLGELDYLLLAPDDRAGALGFGLGQTPPAPMRAFNRALDLERLASLAEAVVAEEDVDDGPEARQAEDLMPVGTSMGGARPKTVVEDADGLWLAKFNRPDDRWNHARVEHAMLELGKACGLAVAQSRVRTIGGRDVLLVKRFDREKAEAGYRRARMISGLTVLRAEDTHRHRERWSYVLLAEALRRVCADAGRNVAELFRRMAFNALISNTDDHPRNHAVIAWERDWRLSPAYDLTPSIPISLERRDLAMICGERGRHAHADNLLSESARFCLERGEAEAIIDGMERRVAGSWYETARRAGVSERDCETIGPAFAYPGFRLAPDGF